MTILEFAERLGLRLSPLKRALLSALYHLPMTEEDRATFERHAGRAYRDGERAAEVTVVAGRRGGKSLLAGLVGLYELLRPETREALSSGEAAVVPIVSRTMDTARTIFESVSFHARTNPLIMPLVRNTIDGQGFREVEFAYDDRNALYLRVLPARHWAVLGRAIPCAVLDEYGYFPQEGASTDRDIVEALEPSLAQFEPHGKILEISSPWVKAGRLWERFRERAALEDGWVFHATSKEFNPWLSDSFLERMRRKDPVAFARNFLAEFTDAIDAFLPAAAVDACVVSGRRAVPPEAGVEYRGFLDAAFKQDRFVFLVASRRAGVVRIDHLRRWYPPVNVDRVLEDVKGIGREYHVRRASGDQFCSEPLRAMFRKECGIQYQEVTLTNETKAQAFGSLRTLIERGLIELLDDPETLRELRALEARVTPAGHVQIGHPRGSGMHDDAAVALALAAHELRPSEHVGSMRVGILTDEEERDADKDSITGFLNERF